MIIDSSTSVALLSYLSAKNNGVSGDNSQNKGSRSDSVAFSAQAIAAALGNDAMFSSAQRFGNEEEIKWNLARIFMDTLFGKQNKDDPDAEKELMMAILEDPTFDTLLQEVTTARDGAGG